MVNPIYRFLQVDHLVCDYDGKPLNGFRGYKKWDYHDQYFYFTLGWLKAFFGDHQVLRFHDDDCKARFLKDGPLIK